MKLCLCGVSSLIYIINNAGIVCGVKRVSLWGLYREKEARRFRGKKEEMSDISLNNGQMDCIYYAHV